MIDAQVVSQRDLLVLFAAGNAGNTPAKTPLSSQAQTKNTLIVGSSQSSSSHFIQEIATYQAAANAAQASTPFCSPFAVSTIFGCLNSKLPEPFSSLDDMTEALCEEYFYNPDSFNSCSNQSALLGGCSFSSYYANLVSLTCNQTLAAAYAIHSGWQFNQHCVFLQFIRPDWGWSHQARSGGTWRRTDFSIFTYGPIRRLQLWQRSV